MPDPAAPSARSSSSTPPAAPLPVEFAAALEGFSRHLEFERARSAHTVRAYTGDAASLLAYCAGHGATRLADIDLSLLRLWPGGQQATGKSRSTLSRHAASARTFLAWTKREELVPHDPSLRLQSPRREKTLPHVLQQGQMQRLLDGASAERAAGNTPGPAATRTPAAGTSPTGSPPTGTGSLRPAEAGDAPTVREADPRESALADRDLALLELLYASGIRVGVLVALDIDDVDNDHRTLRVLGKGNKERTVPFGQPALNALNDWLRRGCPVLAAPGSGPALFLGVRGGRLGQRQAREVVSRALEGLGTPPPAARSPEAHHRDPPARRRRGPARGSGTARAQLAGDHPAVHPRLGRAPAGQLPAGPPARLNPPARAGKERGQGPAPTRQDALGTRTYASEFGGEPARARQDSLSTESPAAGWLFRLAQLPDQTSFGRGRVRSVGSATFGLHRPNLSG